MVRIIRELNSQNLWRFAYACTVKWLPRTCYSRVSNACRVFFARRIAAFAGKKISIERGSTFGSGLRIGDGSRIGYFAEVYGDVSIGKECLIGPQAVFHTSGHGTARLDIPMKRQESTTSRPIVVGDDCWIGQRAIILPGVTIGSHSIVGAGAVVTKSVPPYSVVVGNPARVVKSRLDGVDEATRRELLGE